MLTALPIVLACTAFQPCPEALAPHVVSPRTSSPAAIVSPALPPWHRRSESRPLALENLTLPRVTTPPRSSAQPPLTMHRPRSLMTRVTAAMAGAVAGIFAGAYLGAAIQGDCGCDSPGLRGALIGMPIGGVLGGVLGWNLAQ